MDREDLIPALREAERRIAELEGSLAASRKSERDTAAQNVFLESVLDAVVDTVFVFDPETGRPEKWNRAFRDTSGYSDREIASMRAPSAWYSGEDLEKVEGETQTLARGGRSVVEMDLITKGGHRISTEYTASLIADPRGIPRYIVAVGRDIRERRREQEALRESDERFRVFMDRVPGLAFIKDWEGRVVFANRGFLTYLGLDPNAMLAKTSRDLFPPEYAERLDSDDRRVMQTGASEVIEEKFAGRVWLTHKFVIPSASGHALLGGLVLDYTERRSVEEALRESLDFNRTMFSATPLGIATYRADGQCVSSNPAIPRIVGATTEQVLSQNFRKIESWKRSGLLDDAEKAMSEGVEGRREIHVVSSFGKDVWLDCRVLRFFSNGEPHLLLVIDDVTALKNAEQTRQMLEEKVQQAQKLESLGVLAGGIAHDFNNLLVGIYGNMDLALLDLPEDSPVRDYIAGAWTSAHRAKELINQLLVYAGKGKASIEWIDVAALVREMTGLLKTSISKKVTVRYDLAEDLPNLKGDATQIRQVVMNLVTNASDAMGEGAGEIVLSAHEMQCDRALLDVLRPDEELPGGTYICLRVSDNGCGMDDSCRARLFDPFFSTKVHGRGLGLAAVHGIVRGHRGAIQVHSEPGKGSSFAIYLHVREEAAPRPGPPEVPTRDWHGSGTVLLVDDEPIVREVGTHMLKRLGFEVVTASDGVEGLEAFKRQDSRFAALLLDLNMPRMGGAELCEQLRRLGSEVPVILSSGYDDEEEASQFRSTRGGIEFIRKPFRAESLREILQQALTKTRR